VSAAREISRPESHRGLNEKSKELVERMGMDGDWLMQVVVQRVAM
jgi:hypothetical protein